MTTALNEGDSRQTAVPTGIAASPLLAPWAESPSTVRSYLSLIRELAVTSFKLKYAGSVLGYIWSLIKPLMLFGMMYLIFAAFLLKGRTSSAENFPVELLVAIVLWTFFADATTTALASIAGNGDMIRKAYFPRWILVVASTMSAAMTLIVNAVLIFVLGLLFHWYQVGWQSLLLIPLLLELYVLSLGIGMLLAALYVYYRDLGHIWEILLQLLFYLSAIIFPFSLLSPQLQGLAAMNPVAQIIEDARRAVVSSAIPWSTDLLGRRLVVPLVLVIGALGVGIWSFQVLSKRFGERL
ncbi:MAG: ABC transporter permease [Candidatus Dormibacteraeota bacterium]|uniref:Transport permease protein n=1 Tax=Candidatus Amunia macphersoniae TaxID=3127014 RepID=A0A934NFL0_9BACT|nr:ABC transporter permease [Candidatus Dormibacteraeota bacterium]